MIMKNDEMRRKTDHLFGQKVDMEGLGLLTKIWKEALSLCRKKEWGGYCCLP